MNRPDILADWLARNDPQGEGVTRSRITLAAMRHGRLGGVKWTGSGVGRALQALVREGRATKRKGPKPKRGPTAWVYTLISR